MKPAELRTQIPLLQNYTWLNAAASSPTPAPVFEAMTGFLRDTLARGDIGYPSWARFKDDVRARLALFIGATSAEVGFTPSTSFGFHVIAQMLKARGIAEVLTLETEFPSTTLPMLFDGLSLRGVRMRADGTYAMDDLEAALTPKTGAIAVSAVQYASGFRIDLAAVGELCRARGLTFIINAAQGLGHVPLDVKKVGAHFLAATSHKWFMAGYGTGVLFVDQSWLQSVPLPFGGWLSVEQSEQFKPWSNAQVVDDATGFTATGTKFRKETSALEAGGGSWVGLYAMDAALALHEAVTPAATLERIVELQLKLRAGLRRRGFVPSTPDEPATLSGICVIPVQGTPLEVVRALLREAQVATTSRGAGVRISTHAYNDEGDLDRLLAALQRLGIKPG